MKAASTRPRDGLWGFTLLEVMVAVAILGLALTAVLSSQVGLFATGTYGQNVTVALGLARCRMSEIEEDMAKMGFPETDPAPAEGACCNKEENALRCSWRVERVELPQPNLSTPGLASGASSVGSAPLDFTTQLGFDPTKGPPPPGALGPLGALSDPTNLTPGGGTGALSGALAGGTSSMAPMVMGMVYPGLKPALEASIRKITVIVFWREGSQRRELEIVQWLTNPLRGGLLAVPPPPDTPERGGSGGSATGTAGGTTGTGTGTSAPPATPPRSGATK
ncbi:MAG: prepilin-type N-terminal cleavage/methylation domain-containing protein [Polyangiaceae bacterium]|nr:prepilin-type N-terminal cleavage/methylation domain-containing protein [Polyangiaceae bacterium]